MTQSAFAGTLAASGISIPEGYEQREVASRVEVTEADSNFIVRVSVPKNADRLTSDHAGGLTYCQIGRQVKGGFINIFAHDDLALPGRKVLGRATVWTKTMSDGSEFTYVDVHPLPDGVDTQYPTHDMSIMQQTDDVDRAAVAGHTVFHAVGGIGGGVVLKERPPCTPRS